MSEMSLGTATPEIPLTRAERNAFVELAKRMRRLEVLNLLEDEVWMTTMPRAEKVALINKPERPDDAAL